MKKSLVFAGSGPLVEKLILVCLPHFQVMGVVLSDKMPSASLASMKRFCEARGFPISYDLNHFKADLFLTPNFPRLLSRGFVESQRCINVHFALLPKYRGFHPIQCALLNDERWVGYSVHRVDSGMDSGDIFAQEKIDVTDQDDIHTLTERLSETLVEKFPIYIQKIFSGEITAVPQNEAEAIWCGRRRPEDGLINWGESTRYLFNLIRSVKPPYYPGAYSYMGDRKVVFVDAEVSQATVYRHIPGQILCVKAGKGVAVKTGDTFIWIKRVRIDEEEVAAECFFSSKIGQRFTSNPAT